MDSNYCDDEDYHPHFKKPRFIDLRSKEAEMFNNLIDCHRSEDVIRWDCYEDIGWVFELEDVVLDIENATADTVIVRVTSGSMPRVHIDPLRQELRQMVSSALASQEGILNFAITILQLVEAAVISVQEWKYGRQTEAGIGRKGWDANTVSGKAMFDNPHGLDLATIDDSAFHLLGKSVKQLCEDLEDDEFRILHVENVLRRDLVDRFRKRQKQMLDQLLGCTTRQLRECVPKSTIPSNSSLDDLARELCRPRATYHGTSRWNVSSIVRWGFVLPGQKAGNATVSIAYGSSFGQGIYTSPDPYYALAYSEWSEQQGSWRRTRPEWLPGLRLIICAVLMGRPLQVTREATRRTTEIADQTANSHVSPNLCEYVVFDSAQIIPCYVVHLDFGLAAAQDWLKWAPADNSTYTKRKQHPKLQTQDLFPGEVEALKQAKKAAASKWFPYGFGPATGTSFVIEEIGEVSDDEENYGDYQKQRHGAENEFKEWQTEDAPKSGSWFDEYQTSRTAKAKIKRARGDDDGSG
jgi:Poly(ADP-ribose) polymerase catalytic domain